MSARTQTPAAEDLDPESAVHLRRIERRYENYGERTAFVVRLYFCAFTTLAAVLSHLGGRPASELIERLTTIGVYAVFCASMYVFLGRTRTYHPTIKYISSFVDVALLTLLTWFSTRSQENPILSYFTPMTLIYFVFLTMSAVRNRLRVIAFTLALCLLGYGGLMILAYPEMFALNARLAAATAELMPATAASGGEFRLPSGRPMGIVLRLLYMGLAGGLLIYAVYGARRVARQQTAYLLEQKVLKHAEIDRIKTNFFLNMSHEFRTPLTLILGPIQRLLNPNERLSRESREELLNIILRSSRSMLTNVNNLLDFSRLRAGKLQLQKKAIDLRAHVQSIAEAFRFESESKGLLLEIDLPDRAVAATVDPYLLERALSNLLANAVRFTQNGGVAIRMQVAPAPSAADSADRIQIEVSDSGPGIPSERTAAIFERFETGGTSGGSGLGLPLCREIVELHNGRIDLVPQPGAGARFRIELPLNASNPATPKAQNESSATEALIASPDTSAAPIDRKTRAAHADVPGFPVQGRASAAAFAQSPPPATGPVAGHGLADVLLVDDNGDMRDFVRGILQPYYLVRTAKDGREALESVRRRRPDLLIADVMMPEMSGLMLLEILRAERETGDLPVILLTARSESGDRMEGLRGGADAYLTKPFLAEELLQRAQNLIQRSRNVETNLARERHRIYNELHDSLGARLTDLALQARRMNPNVLAKGELDELNATVSSAQQSLRNALSDSEDLERMRTDFPLGLQLFLLRRYTTGGRSLQWDLSPEVETLLKGPRLSERTRHSLFSVLREVTTNDLKYGHETSRLEFESAGTGDADDHRLLRVRFFAPSRYDPAGQNTGRGRHTIAERVAELGGKLEQSLVDGSFQMQIEIPLTA